MAAKKPADDEPTKPTVPDDAAPAIAPQEPYPTGKPWHEPTPGVPMNEAPKKEE